MAMAMPVAGIRHPSVAPWTTEPLPVWHPSPNFGPRRDGLTPDLVVLHFTAMRSAAEALHRLCDPVSEVSAHYLIGGDGAVWQMVDEEMRAWHAGAGEWLGRGDVNSRSIGIELDNRGSHPFSQPQMCALERLLSDIMARRSIQPQGVIGHSDMAPSRKFDPGPRFDWRRLARQGMAVWPEAGQPGDFGADAARFGYPVNDMGAILSAFRARFRPQAQGPLDDDDRAMMADLAMRFGVDRIAPTS
ncbi:N-acetylmuramoyl-L-alanine amidase [Rhodobacteraceae bacterium F11138]|nr:N-acetylmuramoyl-L-alanine amidase [Rhodobacteraceae bacterium F11138]